MSVLREQMAEGSGLWGTACLPERNGNFLCRDPALNIIKQYTIWAGQFKQCLLITLSLLYWHNLSNYMSVSAEALSEHIHPRCQTDSKLQVNWSKTSQPIQVRWELLASFLYRRLEKCPLWLRELLVRDNVIKLNFGLGNTYESLQKGLLWTCCSRFNKLCVLLLLIYSNRNPEKPMSTPHDKTK